MAGTTTANEPKEGEDPGGTRSTKTHDKGKQTGHKVKAGDRNDLPDQK